MEREERRNTFLQDYWDGSKHHYFFNHHDRAWDVRNRDTDRIVMEGLDMNLAAAIACLLDGQTDLAALYIAAHQLLALEQTVNKR